MKVKIKILTIALLALIHCTHNPFDHDEISSKTSQIRGRVLLEDGNSPTLVHVWLEGFDITTHPDQDGNFQFQLPAPSLQPYGGLNGSYKIFFFVADYKLDSVTVVVRNGLLMTNHGDINENGELRRTRILAKKLRIFINVTPDSISHDSTSAISLTLRLEAVLDTVYVHYPASAFGPLSILFIKDLKNPGAPISIFGTSRASFTAPLITDSISTNPHIWEAGLRFEDLGLERGAYQIIPFFTIDHSHVPAELLNNIGNLIDKPGYQFLDVPTYRQGGTFIVVGIGKKVEIINFNAK